jgi:hypothetical protein
LSCRELVGQRCVQHDEVRTLELRQLADALRNLSS